MKKVYHSVVAVFLGLLPVAAAAQNFSLSTFSTGYSESIGITHAGDDRLFINEQRGTISIADANGNRLPTPFLDISAKVSQTGNEAGLLGVAFHPDYANNGFFYVNYTNPNATQTVVARYSVTADPNVADPNSELIILQVNQPYNNHNGGNLEFGPDGYLYIGLGDGGSGGDPDGNGQLLTTMLGKMLRIDVDGGSPYAIPADNPFVNDASTLDEIWAIGLRNPWQYSFDALTGDLWIGDVGQNAREEIDFEPAGSAGGINYGWRCYEGTAAFNTSGCPGVANFAAPIFEYNNPGDGCSVTGGYVYRGTDYPWMVGKYYFTDFCTGTLWETTNNGDGTFSTAEVADFQNFDFGALGQNNDGELFFAGRSGTIYRLESDSTTSIYENQNGL